MHNQLKLRVVAVVLLSGAAFSLWCQPARTSQSPDPTIDDERLWFRGVSLCQSTARRKDPALLPEIEKTLLHQRPIHGLIVDALVAIGRIGTADALACLERLEPTLQTYYREAYVPVIKARIRAELAFPQVRTREQWQQQVALFLQEAELTQEALRNHPQWGDPMVYPSRGVVAVRVLLELASKAYANGVKEALQLFEGLALERDYPSWLRYQLAPLNTKQRVEWLIRSLTHKKARRFMDWYELLALWQCGEAALPAILAKIEELSAQGPKDEVAQIQKNIGLANLLEVLAGYEDARVEAILERYEQENFKASEFLRRHRKGLRGVLIYDW